MNTLSHVVRWQRRVSSSKRNNDEEEPKANTYGQNMGITSVLCPEEKQNDRQTSVLLPTNGPNIETTQLQPNLEENSKITN